MQKLYAYVDESGQDPRSDFFVVAAVVNDKSQDALRKQLIKAEEYAKTHGLKWHKTAHARRMRYLGYILERNIAKGNVYVAYYHKPLPYFFPMIEVLEQSIKLASHGKYRANIYVDGIDKYKAKKLTNALRASGISLRAVKSRRDESEPIIRLADMWAGCIRSALLKNKDTQELFDRGLEKGYLYNLTKT